MIRIKKRNKIFILFFVLVVILITIIVFTNPLYFKGAVAKYLLTYGLPFVFVFAFLADFFQQPIGPEVPATFAVILGLDLLNVLVLAFIGSFLASVINFYIGKRVFAEKIKGSFSAEKYEKYDKMFSKWGELSLVVAAVSPVPYVPFCWLAGAFKMKFRNFVVFALVPRVLRIAFVVLVFKGILKV